jgi:isochorismate synthase EntC
MFEVKLADLNREWSSKIQNIIEEHRLKVQREKDVAIKKSIEKVKFEEKLKYDKLKEHHKNIVSELKTKIEEKNNEKTSLIQKIELIENEKIEMKQFIKELQSEFQRFYEYASRMQQGDADFIFSKQKILNMF